MDRSNKFTSAAPYLGENSIVLDTQGVACMTSRSPNFVFHFFCKFPADENASEYGRRAI